MRRLVPITALALAACGSQKELRPQQGQALPPAPIGAEAPRGADDLLRTDVQARPARSDEVLTESRERESDRFDLPPQ